MSNTQEKLPEENEELKPKDLQLGNFIYCFGKIEMVTGLVPRAPGDWYICHNSTNQKDNPLGKGIEFSAYPVPLSDEWKKCLRVDEYKFPEWVQFVHQAQNYMKWYANVDLLEILDWDILPKQ